MRVLLLLLVMTATAAADPIRLGEPVGSLTVDGWATDPLSLKDPRTTPLVLVVCDLATCKDEVTRHDQEQFAIHSTIFLVAGDKAAAKAVATKHPTIWPLGYGTQLAAQLGAAKLPAVFIVDTGGALIAKEVPVSATSALDRVTLLKMLARDADHNQTILRIDGPQTVKAGADVKIIISVTPRAPLIMNVYGYPYALTLSPGSLVCPGDVKKPTRIDEGRVEWALTCKAPAVGTADATLAAEIRYAIDLIGVSTTTFKKPLTWSRHVQP
jgi:hypothetical protein